MPAVNKAILIGKLTNEVHLRESSGDSVVANFNLETTESYVNKAGERQETMTQLEWKGNDQLIPASRLCEEELFAEFVGSFTCHILNGYESAKNVYKGMQNRESDAIQWHKENSVGAEQYSEA